LVEVDNRWRVVRLNGAAGAMLGVAPGQAGGLGFGSVFDAGEGVHGRLEAALEDEGQGVVRSLAVSGSERGMAVDLMARRVDGGGVVIAAIDARERLARDAEFERMRTALGDAERALSRSDAIQRELSGVGEAPRLIGTSAPMLRMIDQIERVGPSSATVLIHGESGSGKELVARAIHDKSTRRGCAWVAVNCAAMPETLLESELFGHERGAFTGADRERMGKFELADGGTLFLDEIAELSPAAQAKLLRVLQDGTFVRVGGTVTMVADVRLIAATHRDLAMQVRRGRFREDLFFRLNVFRIDVPPLRDRKEDLRALAEHFHEKHARRLARPVLPLSERSVRRLLTYRWPGNVRELENTVERATLLSEGSELEIEIPDTPSMLSGDGADGDGAGASRDTSSVPRDVLLDLTLDQLQRLQIMHALETRGYRVFGEGGAAEKLGLNPQTLLSRMDKLGIPRPRAMRASLRKGG
jgi:transcriptional regulator with GAF, ATPase, and Fis domain